MSKDLKIMGYLPKKDTTCKLYAIGFPKAWKDILIKAEKLEKPYWNPTYSLPTYALKNSLETWLEGAVSLSPLKISSDDSKWLLSCEREVDLEQLSEHLCIWLTINYLDPNGKYKNPQVKKLIEELIEEIEKNGYETLETLKSVEEVRLFDDKGIPLENYTFQAFSILINNALMGKSIVINNNKLKLYYAGRNHFITEVIEEKGHLFSYGVTFSLQTIPPKREAILLCDCSIHRWISERSVNNVGTRRNPWLNKEKHNVHIFQKNCRLYKLPLYQTYKKGNEYYWLDTELNYYNIYCGESIPKAHEFIADLETYAKADNPMLLSYKVGMSSNGFKENKIGSGLSVSDKKDIYDGVLAHIKDLVTELDDIDTVKSNKNARAKLKLDNINFNKVLEDEDKEYFADRLFECLKEPKLNIEVYAQDHNKACAERIIEKLQSILKDSEQIKFNINYCPLGIMGDRLDSDKVSGSLKRINEIDKLLPNAEELTVAFICLEGADTFKKDGGDPKNAIRIGFALKHRPTQFIVPWESEVEEKDSQLENSQLENRINSTITSAFEDMLRQLGYLRGFDEKLILNDDALINNSTIMAMHLFTQVNVAYGKARYLPLCVEMDYKEGQIYVECDAFSKPRVLYREAYYELAKLSMDRDFEKKCNDAAKSFFKHKILGWKRIYKEDKSLLLLLEADGNTRSLWSGITDGNISKYDYEKAYCPKEFDVGDKDNSYKVDLNDTNIRILRIRDNAEVPDYYNNTLADPENNKFSSISGLFKYQDVYWAIAARPNNSDYKKTYTQSKISNPFNRFATRNIIEIYPMQLQKNDNPNEWVHLTNSLRIGAIQFDEALSKPLPNHLASKLEEYLPEFGTAEARKYNFKN